MNDKPITIVSIAKELGISPSTVSRAFDPSSRISDEVRKKILDHADKLGYIPNRAASRLSMKRITVGVAMSDLYMPGVNELMRGINGAFHSLYDYKLGLQRAMFGKNCRRSLKDALAELDKCDCIIISGCTQADADTVNALSAVKPVGILQSNIPQINSLFTVTPDAVTSAQMAAELLRCCLKNGDGSVMLFTGCRSAKIHSDAADAFEQAASRLGLTLTASFDMKDNPDVLNDILADIKDMPGGIYITSGRSLPLCQRVRKLSPKPALVTFDIYPELEAYLKDGTVDATMYQDLYLQGFKAFELMVRYMVDSTPPPALYTPTPQLLLPAALKYYTQPAEK